MRCRLSYGEPDVVSDAIAYAAVVALEKRRSATQRCEKRSLKPWSALAGVIATQLGDLLSSGCEIFDALLAG
jgi:hypothetical protein